MAKKTIGFVGPDGRTCMCAYTVSTVESDKFVGAIIKGMTGMGPVMDAVRGEKQWSLKIFPVKGKTVAEYSAVIKKAFEDGADGVYIVACPKGNCHHVRGNERGELRVEYTKKILDSIGLGGERLNMYFMSGGQGKSFADAAKEMTERIRELGPNPLNHNS